MTVDEYQQERERFATDLRQATGFTLDQFKELIVTDVLREKIRTVEEAKVPTTEEQVHARHILIAVIEPTPTPEATATPTATLTAAETPVATPTPGGPTPTPTLSPRSDQDALARANEVLSRLRAGEDFAKLAAEFSDDPTNRDDAGDLQWFGRGVMIQEFEDAAFKLEPGQISEPVKTSFGYHLIQVLEKDPNHPLDEATLSTRRSEAFDSWLSQRKSEAKIERRLTPAKIPTIVNPVVAG
jgi:parvulin-like peptidyl-prolyl isomerase